MNISLKTKLRIRFVVLTMVALCLLLGVIVSVSIYNNYQDMVSKSDLILSQLYKSPSAGVRYFSVNVHPGKGAVKPDIVQHVSISPEQAAAYAREALDQNADCGFVDGYRYRVYRSDTGIRIFFLSRSSSIEMLQTASINLIGVSLLSLAAVCVLLILLSGWVVNPLLENHRKQKQFITAASHELKTPLTVISTNAQMLQEEIGESPWIAGILQQTQHLSEMTCDMVTLAKTEEYEAPASRDRICLSTLLTEALELYEGLAEKNTIHLSCQLPEALVYTGNEKEIRQLIGILLDNAFKYCPAGGDILAIAKKELLGVRITFRNTTAPLTDVGAVTERFYRGENASNSRGFGLGLSIGQTIAAHHGGKLSVRVENGDFIADVTLH